MSENLTKIIIENYKGETLEFTMPEETPISILRGRNLTGLTYLSIAVVGSDEFIIEEN